MKRFMIVSIVALAVVSCASLDSGMVTGRYFDSGYRYIAVARLNDKSMQYERDFVYVSPSEYKTLRLGDCIYIKQDGRKYKITKIESEAEKRLITHGRE